MSKMSFLISIIYTVISFVAVIGILAIAATHLYAKFKRAKSLVLSSDSIILIVGGCTGIGKLMAIKLAKQYHATILLVDRKKQLFENVSKQIKKYNGICECFMCDLSDPKSVQKTLQSIKQQTRRIDLMIYNAGIVVPQLSWQAKQQDLNAVTNVNYLSAVKFIKTLLPYLQHGHIGVTASVASISDGGPLLSSYVASKHAIFSYLNIMRQQFKKNNKKTTISIACPYAINTGMFDGFKTKIQRILPMLDETYVSERIIKQFLDKKQVCYIGRRHAFIMKVTRFLPTYLQDWIYIYLDNSQFNKKKA